MTDELFMKLKENGLIEDLLDRTKEELLDSIIYWKNYGIGRNKLAEKAIKYIEECPCDPD